MRVPVGGAGYHRQGTQDEFSTTAKVVGPAGVHCVDCRRPPYTPPRVVTRSDPHARGACRESRAPTSQDPAQAYGSATSSLRLV